MALDSLEDAFKLRGQTETIIVEKAKELVLEALNPSTWSDENSQPKGSYFKRIWRIPELMVTENGLLEYLRENYSRQFDDGDLRVSLELLEKEGMVRRRWTSYWQYHRDNYVGGYVLEDDPDAVREAREFSSLPDFG